MGTEPSPQPQGGTPRDRGSRRLSRWGTRAMVPGTALALITLGTACGGKAAAQPTTPTQLSAEMLAQGLTAEAHGDSALATKDYQQAVLVNPKNSNAYYDLGVIDQRAGEATQAQYEYQQALSVDPDFANALYNLAILTTSTSPTEAAGLYTRAVTVDPKDAPAYLNLGFLLLAHNERPAGIADLEHAIALDHSLASRVPAADLATTPVPAKRAPVRG